MSGTAHPLELLDPNAVRCSATGLLGVAAALEECAAGYERLRDHRWTGPAADAARERLDLFALPLRASAQDLRTAAGALHAHAAVLDEALAHVLAARREEERHAAESAAQARAGADAPGLSPAPLPATETYGPRPEVVAALRAAAEGMVEQSALSTAAILLEVGARAPDVTRTPITRTERTDHWFLEHGGERVDAALDTAGAASSASSVPGVGVAAGAVGTAADVVHMGLYLARGRWTDAASTAVGLVPVAGDAAREATSAAGAVARARRLADQAVEDAQQVEDVRGRVEEALGYVGAAGAAVDAAHAPAVGLVDGPYDQVYPTALRADAGAGHGVLPSATLATAVLAGPTVRYRPAPDPRTGRVERVLDVPTRWTATAEVERGGRVVTYEMTLGPGLRRDGEPRAVRSRPLPPDVGRPRRAGGPGARAQAGPWPVEG